MESSSLNTPEPQKGFHSCSEMHRNLNVQIKLFDLGKQAGLMFYAPRHDVRIAHQISYCPWCGMELP